MAELTPTIDGSLRQNTGFTSSILPETEAAWAQLAERRQPSLWARSAPALIESGLDAVLFLVAGTVTGARDARRIRRALVAWWVSEGRSPDLGQSVADAAALDARLTAALREEPWLAWWRDLGSLPVAVVDARPAGLEPPGTVVAVEPDIHPARLPRSRAAAVEALRGPASAALRRRAAGFAPNATPADGLLASAVGEVLMDREIADRIRHDLRAGTEAALFYLPKDFLVEFDETLADAISGMGARSVWR